jgi:hypothetical protein
VCVCVCVYVGGGEGGGRPSRTCMGVLIFWRSMRRPRLCGPVPMRW